MDGNSTILLLGKKYRAIQKYKDVTKWKRSGLLGQIDALKAMYWFLASKYYSLQHKVAKNVQLFLNK